MSMIKLSDGCYVAADQVQELKVNDSRTGITVRMKDGVGHYCEPRYGKSVYEEISRLANAIDWITEKRGGKA